MKKLALNIAVFAAGIIAGVCALQAPRWLASAPRAALAHEPHRQIDAPADLPARGLWNRARSANGSLDSAAAQTLQSIGYLSGYSPAKTVENVTRHDKARSFNALNLYTSGHAPEAILLDMDGRVLHTWRYAYEEAFADPPLPSTPSGTEHWRFAHLLDNGDLLAIYEGQGLIRLSADSTLIWALKIGAHHRLVMAPSGDIYVLTRELTLAPAVNPIDPVLEDFITRVSPDGRVTRRISLLRAFENSAYRPMLDRAPQHGDPFHTNSLQLIEPSGRARRAPPFAAGDVLVSIPMLDSIAVLNLDRETVVWTLTGQWRFQHTPQLLPNGRIVMFDNGGLGDRSTALEIDPYTQERTWAYSGGETDSLYSEFNGAVQRLPNGNTLITESGNGRALEVTADGRVVWEFYNPHRAGVQRELIATLFEMQRLRPDFPIDWLHRKTSTQKASP